jgi:hypothetical protein
VFGSGSIAGWPIPCGAVNAFSPSFREPQAGEIDWNHLGFPRHSICNV